MDGSPRQPGVIEPVCEYGAGLPLAVVNPRQIRDFARATGRLAKTDALDVHAIALFAERIRPEPRPVADADAQALAELVGRRRQVVEMIGMEAKRAALFTRASQTNSAPWDEHGRHRQRRGRKFPIRTGQGLRDRDLSRVITAVKGILLKESVCEAGGARPGGGYVAFDPWSSIGGLPAACWLW